ncbi:MAG: hypothetical protein WC381_03095 [Kiritimatiellia bacterium]|jgi:uncharacterized membrane protein
MDEQRIHHLDMIRAVISRMAQNSFTLKGWALTLIAGTFALSAKETNHGFLFIALFPAVAFWGLDAYYLRLEAKFRQLYDEVRMMSEEQWTANPFDLNPDKFNDRVDSWSKLLFSPSEAGYYVPVLLVVAGIIVAECLIR